METTLSLDEALPRTDAGPEAPGQIAGSVLAALAARQPLHCPIALVTAHPDDESIGMGGMLVRVQNLTIVSLTDGAPRDPVIAERAGFLSRQAYGEERRRELVDALQVTTQGLARLVPYEVMDGCLVDHLDILVERLVADLLSVEAVFTHSYEGGHLDHDVAAYGVQQACEAIARTGSREPARLEFTSYHQFHGLVRSGDFFPDPGCPEIEVPLDPDAAWRKELAFACHKTQASNLRFFGFGPERVRRAPRYDFSRLPPTGEVLYGHAEWDRFATARARFKAPFATGS